MKTRLFPGLEVAPGAYVILAMMLLLIPLRWILAWVIAAMIHEMCHLGMIYLTGGCVNGFRIGPNGAQIHSYPMPCWKEMLCAAAGPAGSILLLLFARWFPGVAICGMLQALWNLIPLYPLDGGRVANCLISLVFPRYAHRIIKAIRAITICVLTVACVVLMRLFPVGLIPVLFLAGVIIKVGVIKFPCKQGRMGVQ